jgi:death-on-curing protein
VSEFLTLSEVLAIHADQIDRYGGAHGVRDRGLLESALYRPQTGYYADVVEEASALWESLSQNHPFVDGNKRTAFAVMYTFLAYNNFWITAGLQDTTQFVLGLYKTGQFKFENVSAWLRRNTVERQIKF